MRSNTEILRTRKDSLARLLATEDLIIEHKKVPTAYFEPDTRKLVCPILKDDMSNQLYDLFMGHEVGHALITQQMDGTMQYVKKVQLTKDILMS